jgi:hypothetical protein
MSRYQLWHSISTVSHRGRYNAAISHATILSLDLAEAGQLTAFYL